MRQIFSVALLNFKQATRDKFFLGVVFFFVFFLAFCALLGKLSPGESQKVLRSAGLAGIELTAVILVVFSLILSFYKEKDSHLLSIYLTNFSRTSYITGKFAGHLLLCFFYLFLSGCGYVLLLILYNAFCWQCIVAVYPLFLKLSIVVGFSLIFCTFFSSPIIALLSSLFLYFAAEVAHSALKVIIIGENKFKIALFKLLYYLLPNMDKLDIKSQVVYGKLPSPGFFLLISFYTFVYILFLWLLVRFIFLKKEY